MHREYHPEPMTPGHDHESHGDSDGATERRSLILTTVVVGALLGCDVLLNLLGLGVVRPPLRDSPGAGRGVHRRRAGRLSRPPGSPGRADRRRHRAGHRLCGGRAGRRILRGRGGRLHRPAGRVPRGLDPRAGAAGDPEAAGVSAANGSPAAGRPGDRGRGRRRRARRRASGPAGRADRGRRHGAPRPDRRGSVDPHGRELAGRRRPGRPGLHGVDQPVRSARNRRSSRLAARRPWAG